MRQTIEHAAGWLDCAGRLEAIARGAESVDAGVPIWCGVAADTLYALVGTVAHELPVLVDQPREIARLLEEVEEDLAPFAGERRVDEVLLLIGEARRQ